MRIRGCEVDYSTTIFGNRLLFEKLSDTSDQGFIGQIIASTDDSSFNKKIFLIQRNSNLTEENLRVLAGDKNHHVRAAVAQQKVTSSDVLTRLLADESEQVRVQALWNPQTSMEVFAKAVLRGKFSSSSKKGFCVNDKAVKSVEVFDFLWETVRGSHVLLVDNMNYVAREKHEVIKPRILNVVHKAVREESVSKALKESYARAVIALPEILDDWKDDLHKPVIEGIAVNSSAWVETHKYLYSNHKTKRVLSNLAWATRDHELLNRIYHGTKSAEIRYRVEKNPAYASI